MNYEEFTNLKINDEVIYKKSDCCEGRNGIVDKISYSTSPFGCLEEFEVGICFSNGERRKVRPENIEFPKPESGPRFLTRQEALEQVFLDSEDGLGNIYYCTSGPGDRRLIPISSLLVCDLKKDAIFIKF